MTTSYCRHSPSLSREENVLHAFHLVELLHSFLSLHRQPSVSYTHLDISRNTVNTAYSQLLVEGFITSRPGSGFYVEKIPLPVTLNQTTPSATPEAQSPSCTYDFEMCIRDRA